MRRTVFGDGPPARGDMGTSQKSGFVWTLFMGFASVIAASPAPLPEPNARQLSNRRSFIPYFRGCGMAVECCAQISSVLETATQSCGATFGT